MGWSLRFNLANKRIASLQYTTFPVEAFRQPPILMEHSFIGKPVNDGLDCLQARYAPHLGFQERIGQVSPSKHHQKEFSTIMPAVDSSISSMQRPGLPEQVHEQHFLTNSYASDLLCMPMRKWGQMLLVTSSLNSRQHHCFLISIHAGSWRCTLTYWASYNDSIGFAQAGL